MTIPHISIKAETVFSIWGFGVTNSLLLSSVVLFLFALSALYYSFESAKKGKSTFFYLITFVVRSVYNLFETVFSSDIKYFFPIVGSFFFFILLQNWFGLLPGVGSIVLHRSAENIPLFRSNSADLNSTLTLAIIAVIMVQYLGITRLGFKDYLSKFFNFTNPINFFVGILEIISELSRIISFSFRLFGNIFAGEVLLTVVAFLVPILVSFPFLLLEVFVGAIQALVFSMLAGVLFKLAVSKQHYH